MLTYRLQIEAMCLCIVQTLLSQTLTVERRNFQKCTRLGLCKPAALAVKDGMGKFDHCRTDILLKFADPSLQQRERVTEASKKQADSAKEISV